MKLLERLLARPSWLVFIAILVSATTLTADPCGMVPPIYTGPGNAISRIGLQQTYVYFDDGVESFVIRPGFQGKVDNFGMLIPFPTAPSLRKVPDNVFEQIAAAVDPPEVVVDLTPRPVRAFALPAAAADDAAGGFEIELKKSEVRVIREEAVGMYEVAVLEAGSPEALKRWMDKNKYVYPEGMDSVTDDYIQEGWCFVAVKTKVGSKADADPKPGQRNARPQMPSNSVFDGNVQGLGFRFRTDELVVPMRLSAFNEGELRNVVYLLSRGGKRINAIPEEYVMRQVSGDRLLANMTMPLPVRVIGGSFKDIPERRKQRLEKERDPKPHNGVAKQIFASDILAGQNEDLALPHEENEKELFRLTEHFGLRGPDIDKAVAEVVDAQADKQIAKAYPGIKQLTMTVIDGDFPREVIANQNLTFADYRLDQRLNNDRRYDTKLHGPSPIRKGRRVSFHELKQLRQPVESLAKNSNFSRYAILLAVGLLMSIGIVIRMGHKSQKSSS